MAELDDDREGLPEALDEDAGDPAAAFDALRQTVEGLAGDLTREMTTIRKGVEAAFEEFDRQGPAQDYKPELAQIVQQLAHVAERLHGVEQSPILRQGAQHYAAALERSGEGLVRTAVQQLERQAADLERAGRNLGAYTKSAYDRKSQDFRMWMAGLIGLFVGIFLILLLPRFLPFSADSHVAALVIGQDRWNAGVTMMRVADPRSWRSVADSSQLVRGNAEAIGQCAEAARMADVDQRCTIIVKAPVRQQN
ncbi:MULTISPECIES: DUF6118 family protein [Hyphomicrobiales]|uniref:Uncharacterized protein n=1 Tax=Brucella pituitosa TaxID=571256 RepID=A0A643ET32_9HYPH|nr:MULTISPECIES: DUF6118 family protein [Hyphomicrobiales]KAB0564656.1 hypothetical protein F7Q93_24230 [Brucella pituitosa]MCZ7889818.1 DUF6118 family protein [Agrobacterium salinitolerans]MDA5636376.1 DUF6118 family protein [Agrobacterium sp. ST15.16.024]MDF1892192.1 DUF6118 family protein [Rhizobium rhizogenes]